MVTAPKLPLSVVALFAQAVPDDAPVQISGNARIGSMRHLDRCLSWPSREASGVAWMTIVHGTSTAVHCCNRGIAPDCAPALRRTNRPDFAGPAGELPPRSLWIPSWHIHELETAFDILTDLCVAAQPFLVAN
jgi:hypothetical protein